MPAEVLLRDARAVAAAPQVHLPITERFAHLVEIGDPRARRVLRRIDAFGRELPRAQQRFRHRIDVEFGVLVGRERGTVERRRAAGAALVDQHDVARAADRAELQRERTQRRGRLAGAAGDQHERVGCGGQRVRRQHGDEDGEPASLRMPPVFGHVERAALRGLRDLRQPALGERHASRARCAIAASGHGQRKRDDDQGSVKSLGNMRAHRFDFASPASHG
jgi:hypothetical protein